MALARIGCLRAKLLQSEEEKDAEVGQPNLADAPRCMVMATQVIGLGILALAVFAWMSPPPTWSAGVSHAAYPAGDAPQLAEQQSAPTCSRATGGTCFVMGCSASRGNTTCEVSLGAGPFGWHSCNCQAPTPCAHSDGRCYARPETGWRSSLHGESEWTVVFAMAPVMRSGVSKLLSEVFALDHVVGVPGVPPEIDFTRMRTWDEVRKASNFKFAWQAYFVSALKAVALHAMQPCLFLLPYFAYASSMGWVQYLSATVVVVNELLYLGVIPFGICMNPKWLLYPPLNDTQKPFFINMASAGAVWYLVAPAGFIGTHCGMDRDLFDVLFLFGLFASLCSWIAIAVGLLGYGVMFPSLFVGYMLSACEAPALVVWIWIEGIRF